jgi:hypothetical protein
MKKNKKRKSKKPNVKILRPFFESVGIDEPPDILEGTELGEWIRLYPILDEYGAINSATRSKWGRFCHHLDSYKDYVIKLEDIKHLEVPSEQVTLFEQLRDEHAIEAARILDEFWIPLCELEIPVAIQLRTKSYDEL